MLHRLTLRCQVEAGPRPIPGWGALLHGVLLHTVPPDAGTTLHNANPKPFAQYIEPLEAGAFLWHICAWEDAAAVQIHRAFVRLPSFALYPDNHPIPVRVLHAAHARLSADALVRHAAQEAPLRAHHTVRLLSPTAHKHLGRYTNFPTPALLYRDLYRRAALTLDPFALPAADALDELTGATQITRYSLWSSDYRFKNDSAVVPAYQGEMDLLIRGHVRLKRLAAILISLAPYHGLGVKTALGMGGCAVMPAGGDAAPLP